VDKLIRKVIVCTPRYTEGDQTKNNYVGESGTLGRNEKCILNVSRETW
jgi:hypothetical protein